MAKTDGHEEFSGEIVQISSRFWANGWGHAVVRLDSTKDTARVVGSLEGHRVGMRVSFTGSWVNNPRFGAQIEVVSIVCDLPVDHRGVSQWIMDVLPQIGPVRAAECVNRFGIPGLWEAIESDPVKLCVIPGITEDRAKEISNAYALFKANKDRDVELFDLGLEKKEITRLAARHTDLLPYIKENPYKLYYNDGFSFPRACVIAEASGLENEDPRSVEAICVERIRRVCYDSGHTYVMVADLRELMESDGWSQKEITLALRSAINHMHIAVEDDALYVPRLLLAEQTISKQIHTLRANGLDRTGPDSGGGGQHDPHRHDGSSDGVSGYGEDHDLEDCAGQAVQRGGVGESLGSNWKGRAATG